MDTTLEQALGGSPFDGTEFRWRLGVRALDPIDWIQVDGSREIDLAEKAELLATRFADVVAFASDSRSASVEILDLVRDQLHSRDIPAESDDHEHPLVAAARLVQEDLCVMERRSGKWVLTAGVVCFPTKWTLADKVGHDMAEIHSPVPGIDRISPAIDRFFDRLRPGSAVVRSNWSLTADQALRLEPTGRQAPPVMPADPGKGLWLRVERQTLRRLCTGDAICFTIRIHRWALGDVVDQLPASAFAMALASIPNEIAEYKDIEEIRSGLLDWLNRR